MQDLDIENFELAAKILNACSHKMRYKLLMHIYRNPDITVKEIYRYFTIEQSYASILLKPLREAGLVQTMQRNKFVHYRVKEKTIVAINRLCGLIIKEAGVEV